MKRLEADKDAVNDAENLLILTNIRKKAAEP